jgi:hypothetical protein
MSLRRRWPDTFATAAHPLEELPDGGLDGVNPLPARAHRRHSRDELFEQLVKVAERRRGQPDDLSVHGKTAALQRVGLGC